MSKLLDDAKAAGFGVFQGEIYANISYKENDDNRVITKNLAKFAALQIPDGYRLVPIEPTHEMIDEGFQNLPCTPRGLTYKTTKDVYKAMLDASPPTIIEDI